MSEDSILYNAIMGVVITFGGMLATLAIGGCSYGAALVLLAVGVPTIVAVIAALLVLSILVGAVFGFFAWLEGNQ